MKPPHEKFPPKQIVLADSSVFLHFAFVRRLEQFIGWFPQKVALTSIVKREVFGVVVKKPEFGSDLDLEKFIRDGHLILEKMDSQEETVKYFGYKNRKFNETEFHSGESSCLAVSLAKQYGLICDERQVLDEFKSVKSFEAPAWTSKNVVELALREKFLSRKDADEILLGFGSQI